MIRVVSGTYKRRLLKQPDPSITRPTKDVAKEGLFSSLGDIKGLSFLDLFSGSGGIGIEALSRGAKEAVFVEKNPKAMACIKDNLKYTKLNHKAVTLTKDVMTALYQLEGEKNFDFIFMDPPYHQNLEKKVLEYLAESDLVYEDTVIIVEAAKDTDFSYIEDLGFYLIKEKIYKTNKHVFLGKEGKEEIC